MEGANIYITKKLIKIIYLVHTLENIRSTKHVPQYPSLHHCLQWRGNSISLAGNLSPKSNFQSKKKNKETNFDQVKSTINNFNLRVATYRCWLKFKFQLVEIKIFKKSDFRSTVKIMTCE
jgi:hypothetical protein